VRGYVGKGQTLIDPAATTEPFLFCRTISSVP
jgi:hypothetical protein